jgi:HK97 family phage major capsid protein/HK97 family phage prohead protease
MNRAYTILEIKKVDEEERVISGIASTPTPDRVGDVVEPMGAKFSLPMPLLWQHRSGEPVGHVEWAKPGKDGIPFRARFVKTNEPGRLKDRLDEAWQSVKLGLVRAVSIGFSILEISRMKDGGYHILEWEWLELSVVTIPANQDATIQTVKSIDRKTRAALGLKDDSTTRPGASGKTITPKITGKKSMTTFKEKIENLKAQIGPKETRMKAILQAAMDDDDRSLNESEKEDYDELAAEVKELRENLARFEASDVSASTAKPVQRGDTQDGGSDARGGGLPAEAKVKEEPGVAFARLVRCYAAAKGAPLQALERIKSQYPNMSRIYKGQIETILKAQVAGATTTDPSWAAPLVDPTNLVSEFVEFLRPMTILGKFGVGNIPGLRPIPFNVRFPAQISGGDADWVGEGKAKPLTKFDFSEIILRWTKVANIAVLSEDVIKFSSPSADMLVRNALAEALQARLDSDFVNPSITLIAEVRPASITNGAATQAASGIDADAVRADLRWLFTNFITADLRTGGAVLVMRESQALSLSLMRNALGQREFPDITMAGGMLEGVPVITSQYVPQGVVVAVIAPEIYLADDGGVSIDLSREASLEMADDPTNNINEGSPPAPVESAMVSMFQTNSVAIRCERMINWRRRRTAAVAYLTSTGWGNEDTSPPQAAI